MATEIAAKQKNIRPKCEHGRVKYSVKVCGGYGLCEHGETKAKM